MKTHYAVRRRVYSGFGSGFARELDANAMTRACSVMQGTTAPITRILANVECGACKRTYDYRNAVEKVKELR